MRRPRSCPRKCSALPGGPEEPRRYRLDMGAPCVLASRRPASASRGAVIPKGVLGDAVRSRPGDAVERRNHRPRLPVRKGPSRVATVSYAARRWKGVRSGSISETNPRSQLTTTCPRSSIWSTIPRSPAHSPDSSAVSPTSSIRIPIDTPARMRAARSLAPYASIVVLSASLRGCLILPRKGPQAGDETRLAKLRPTGEPLRTRRLRAGSPASRRAP